ncbi:MAG: cell envelope integrity protein CreD [Bacteroidia bacterium]|nr:cell envelope integrity protein CreD [Bacteroidia bacterium]
MNTSDNSSATQIPKTPQHFTVKRKPSLTTKLLVIALLLIIMVVPWALLEFLVYDRQRQSEKAIDDVSNSWSNEQIIKGPILYIPYKVWTTDANHRTSFTISRINVLPDELYIDGKVEPEKRYRGIYEVVVYSSALKLRGKLRVPDLASMKIRSEDILWDEAYIGLGITDMRGIRDDIDMKLGDSVLTFDPGIGTTGLTGVSSAVNFINDSIVGKEFDFSFNLNLNGSRTLSFEPVGGVTNVKLNSPWVNPSFQGAFLPDERQVSESGFVAEWKVLHLNRNYPQLWKDDQFMTNQSAFGVDLMVPVDHYTKSSRATKYAILIIGLSFLVYFFVEVMQEMRIHPFQYILVGLAISIFYLLLISFSEHMKFNLAYVVSALATIAAVTVYSGAIFKKKKATLIMGVVQVLLYGFMFVIIQLEDYALLVGSIAIFIVLIVLMYLSRKINWYEDEVPETQIGSGNG